ncbi:MAG TPA: FAD:protein FMN transferase [Longimicrobium sp.]|nr:FAD:protein FMN transferase [Longimicrobium sp.]
MSCAAAALLMSIAACTHPRSPAPVVDESRMGPRYVSADTTPDAPPVIRSWPVMGALLRISVWDGDSARALTGIDAARAAVFRVAALTSGSEPGSDLSLANRRAGTDSTTVLSPWTAEVLGRALEISGESAGALDVTAAPLADAWGVYRGRGAVPPRAVRDSVALLVGWQKVRFDRATRAVRLPVRGMRLDLGGIAKGYALDRAVEALRAAGVTQGLVDLGGNFRVFGTPPVGERWIIGLKDPRDDDEVFAAVQMDSGAVGISGGYEQFHEAGGTRYSHILDPRTGEPARGVVSVAVIAPSGVLADALSKPLYVMGIEEGCRYARRHPGLDVVWVRDDGSREEKEDADEGLDPELVVITDALAGRLELLSEEPREEKPRTCGEVLGDTGQPRD